MRGCSILWAVMRFALTASNAMPQAKINPFVLPHEVCLLINYNVTLDRTNGMATISVRQRTNVAEPGHVQATQSRN